MRQTLRNATLWLALAVLGFPLAVHAQTQIDHTTWTAAVTATATSATLTAASGVAAGGCLYTDGELIGVRTVDSATVTMRRGLGDGFTPGRAHSVNAIVWVGACDEFKNFNVQGTCTAGTERFLPHINTKENRIYDCGSRGYWIERERESVNIQQASTVCGGRLKCREEFNGGHGIMQDDGTAKSLDDAEENFVYGSPLGIIEYREELGKTTSSWVTIDGQLDISADDTIDEEGVEIVFGATSDAALNQVIEAGTHGACISAMITITDISGTDQVQLGWRQNEAFQDVAAYGGYTVWNTVGPNNVDGSIVSSQEVSEATDTDDSAVNWADGERRALKVCISSTGVPTAYYTAASPDNEEPIYIPITMTETGGTLTAGTGMVPFFSYLAETTDGADVTIQWVQLEYAP